LFWGHFATISRQHPTRSKWWGTQWWCGAPSHQQCGLVNCWTISFFNMGLFHGRSPHIIFSSPGPKVHVNYCHHLASVVCKLFSFQASSPKPLGRLEPNLANFVLVGYSIWLPGPIMCSDWLKFQRSSLKLMNWLNPNCKWMIIGMSFTKLLFLCRPEIQDGCHRRT
jgi:hypothetical protein